MVKGGSQAPATTAASAPSSHPNGARPSNQLIVSHEGRKPLFTTASNSRASTNGTAQASPRLKATRFSTADGTPGSTAASKLGTGLLRRTKSESLAALSQPKENAKPNGINGDRYRRDSNSSGGMSPASPGGTRIPRPTSSASFHPRRPMSLAEAFKRAGEELEAKQAHAIDGSPSPAPRSWRAKNARDETKMRQALDHDHLDTKAREKQSIQQSEALKPRESPPKSSDSGPNRGLDLRTGLRRSPDRAKTLVAPRYSSDSSSHGIPDLVPGIEDIPLPSVEEGQRGLARSPRRNENKSPEKSFAWDIEDDFTAGDLQISESPRIRVGSNRPFASRPSLLNSNDRFIRSPARLTQPGSKNSKLDEIRALELKSTSQIMAERPVLRQGNTRLDEIRAREKAVEAQIPIPDANQPRPKNTKLEEIRQLEARGLSKRVYAATRLEEILEQNAMSRSVSPEEARPRSSQKEPPQPRTNISGPRQETRLPTRAKPSFETVGEPIPDTPITVYKNRQDRDANSTELEKGVSEQDPSNTRDSHDLLRRLARATSASPAPETGKIEKPQPAPLHETAKNEGPRPPSILSRPLDKNRRATTAAVPLSKDESSKPTVGFTGLRRADSLESARSKRSSVHSETDPVDRIEAEMQLFAPKEDQSERGSLHVPSPPSSAHSDDDGLGEPTPRMATKYDYESMPTPRVTGAYVETPATVKFDNRLGRRENRDRFSDKPAADFDGTKRVDGRSRDTDTASDPGTSDYNRDDRNDRDNKIVSTAVKLRKRRRTQSLPRRRPPLKNSVKLPSAKDDLLELQRKHNFDDSTVDNFDDVLGGLGKTTKSQQLSVKRECTSSSDEQLNSKHPEMDDSTIELVVTKPQQRGDSDNNTTTLQRMSKTLTSGFRHIAIVKQGIDQLVDHVSVATSGQTSENKKKKPLLFNDKPKTESRDNVKHEQDCPACEAKPDTKAVAYFHLPVPRLYHSTPRFRLSLLGLGLLIMALWLAAESAMCAQFCRPTTCSSGNCIYSFDDPTFGSALPVKLDQWTTGGYGRDIAGWAWEAAQDVWADAEDALLGRSVADVSMQGMSIAQKRQHRRRLAKKGLRPAARAHGGGDPTPEQRVKWDAWRRTRRELERAREARAMGYYEGSGTGGDASAMIGDDERVG